MRNSRLLFVTMLLGCAPTLLACYAGSTGSPNTGDLSDASVDAPSRSDSRSASPDALTLDVGAPDVTVKQEASVDASREGETALADASPADADAGDASQMETGGTDTGTPGGYDLFIATGYNNRRIVSRDGTTWTNDISEAPLDSGDDNINGAIAFGLGKIVVVNETSINVSSDGQSWTNQLPAGNGWGSVGGAAAFGNGTFVIVPPNGSSWTSTDGMNWTKHTFASLSADANLSANHWDGMAFGNGVFLAVGDGNATTADTKSSANGVNWTTYTHEHDAGGGWTGGIAFGGASGSAVFVLVGSAGLAWTTNGETLTKVDLAQQLGKTPGALQGVAYGNGEFLAISENLTAKSTDGKNWTLVATVSGGRNYNQLAYGNGHFITTEYLANILTSTDGATWSQVFSGVAKSNELLKVGWGHVSGSP